MFLRGGNYDRREGNGVGDDDDGVDVSIWGGCG